MPYALVTTNKASHAGTVIRCGRSYGRTYGRTSRFYYHSNWRGRRVPSQNSLHDYVFYPS